MDFFLVLLMHLQLWLPHVVCFLLSKPVSWAHFVSRVSLWVYIMWLKIHFAYLLLIHSLTLVPTWLFYLLQISLPYIALSCLSYHVHHRESVSYNWVWSFWWVSWFSWLFVMEYSGFCGLANSKTSFKTIRPRFARWNKIHAYRVQNYCSQCKACRCSYLWFNFRSKRPSHLMAPTRPAWKQRHMADATCDDRSLPPPICCTSPCTWTWSKCNPAPGDGALNLPPAILSAITPWTPSSPWPLYNKSHSRDPVCHAHRRNVMVIVHSYTTRTDSWFCVPVLFTFTHLLHLLLSLSLPVYFRQNPALYNLLLSLMSCVNTVIIINPSWTAEHTLNFVTLQVKVMMIVGKWQWE